MTPERKEVIKEDAQYEVDSGYGHSSSDISNQEALELLAALEESQQHNKRLEMKLQASRDSVYPLSVERDEYKLELSEAQQTIARQQQKIDAALSWTWNCGEANMLEVIAALKGDTQP